MYAPDSVVVIDLTLSQESIEALEVEPDEYQPGTFSLAFTDGTPGGTEEPSEPLEVGIRLKGKLGSFRSLAEKAAFKLKFNEMVDGQKFLGLKKLTLNNMVQDASMIHETLAYAAFRSAGVPAPRTGYAYVRVNGEDYGLYMNVETFDDVALKRWFGSFKDPQHLYEGEYGVDVMPGEAGAFEVDEGDAEDRSDLEGLIAAVADSSSPFSGRMTPFADLEEMTRMWAVERYVGHWDGYSGLGGTEVHFALLPNNYYLYSDPVGRFQMLPWGTDQTWDMRLSFQGDAGLMFDRCLEDSECDRLYRDSLTEVAQAIADLDALAQGTAELLEPWQLLEQLNSRHEHDLEEIEAAVVSTREFIAERPEELAAWLNPPVEDLPDAPAPAPPAPEPPATSPVRVGKPTIADGVLVTRLRLSLAGKVSQRAKIRTVSGVIGVCATRIEATGAAAMTLRCPLSSSVRRRLSVRWLKLWVDTSFTPGNGSAESVVHEVHARRVEAGAALPFSG